MAHPQAQPLRPLTPEERHHLERLSRARSAPAEQVARAAMLLAVSQGHPFTLAAQHVGRTSGNAVARLVRRFNLEGLEALTHGMAVGTWLSTPRKFAVALSLKPYELQTRNSMEPLPGP